MIVLCTHCRGDRNVIHGGEVRLMSYFWILTLVEALAMQQALSLDMTIISSVDE